MKKNSPRARELSSAAAGKDMEEKIVAINGIKTFVRIAGEGNPFLILHGWGRGHISWIETQDSLSKHFQVIALDMPGFGQSDLPPSAWGVGDYAQFVLDFVEHLGIEKFNLLGHSFGGSVAIKLAVQWPEKIRKLILVSSAGRRPERSFSKKVLGPLVSFFKIFSFLPGYELLRRFFYRFILRKTDYIQAEGVMKEVFKNVVAEDLSSLWERISLPTLIIWGKVDDVTPLRDGLLMKEKIKNSELKVFDCGHRAHRDIPDILVKTILDFL